MMRVLTLSSTALVLAVFAVALLSRPSGVVAGTAVRMDVTELTHGSDLIVEARVLSAASLESDGRIETEYLIQVERTFAGEDRPFRTVRLPGGVLDDGRGMMLAGMPRIEPGDDTLLFLSAEGSTGIRMPVGLAQGTFNVVRTSSGRRLLRRDTAGVTLLSETGALIRGEGSTILEYAEVASEIEAALATRRDK
jgi:hypothetical protein